MAEGATGTEIVAWILDHDGKPEMASTESSKGGLFGSRLGDGRAAHSTQPLRYVLPRGALAEPSTAPQPQTR